MRHLGIILAILSMLYGTVKAAPAKATNKDVLDELSIIATAKQCEKDNKHNYNFATDKCDPLVATVTTTQKSGSSRWIQLSFAILAIVGLLICLGYERYQGDKREAAVMERKSDEARESYVAVLRGKLEDIALVLGVPASTDLVKEVDAIRGDCQRMKQEMQGLQAALQVADERNAALRREWEELYLASRTAHTMLPPQTGASQSGVDTILKRVCEALCETHIAALRRHVEDPKPRTYRAADKALSTIEEVAKELSMLAA